MAASASPKTPQPAPEVIMADAPLEGEREMLPLPPWDSASAAEHREKYSRYQTAYARRLKAKYFSRKDLDGGDVFDQEMNIDGETIKAGRWPCTRSFIEQATWSPGAGAFPVARRHNSKRER
ncbi:uncharacterized protein LOC144709283 [Wolffia australiana]